MATKYEREGGVAFPAVEYDQRVASDGGGPMIHRQHPGMSLRDYFAAKAVIGITLSGPHTNERFISADEWPRQVAEAAYKVADAMLALREFKKGW